MIWSMKREVHGEIETFAVELVFYDKDKNELQRVDGTKETVEVPVETAFHEGGHLPCECDA